MSSHGTAKARCYFRVWREITIKSETRNNGLEGFSVVTNSSHFPRRATATWIATAPWNRDWLVKRGDEKDGMIHFELPEQSALAWLELSGKKPTGLVLNGERPPSPKTNPVRPLSFFHLSPVSL